MLLYEWQSKCAISTYIYARMWDNTNGFSLLRATGAERQTIGVSSIDLVSESSNYSDASDLPYLQQRKGNCTITAGRNTRRLNPAKRVFFFFF